MEQREFGKFTLLEHMGRGGMGSVYRAFDNQTGHIIAVKTFESAEGRSPEVNRKLRDREVRMLVSARHPNIVRFFESGHVEDDYYYTMEFVEDSLLNWVRSGREVAPADKVHILRQTADALTAVHRQGLVHRDVKPGNILLDQDPNGTIHVKLTDFGIAKNVSEADIVVEQTHRRIPGTPRYLSPEQVDQKPLDGRSDIFSLGVVAYELIAGASPFDAQDAEGFYVANVEQRQRPACEANPNVPPFLSQIVDKMLVKDREERYDSETLVHDLILAHRHLTTGAPLAETANAASIFYTGPREEPEPAEPFLASISRGARATALAIAVVAVAVLAALWPGRGAPPTVGGPGGPPLTRAQAAAGAGQYWRALALLGTLKPDNLTPAEREARQQLSAEVASKLADAYYESGQAMIEQGRIAEARILLERMQKLAPTAARTQELATEVEQASAAAGDDQNWAAQLQRARADADAGHQREALSAARALLSAHADDPEVTEAARATVAQIFDGWGRRMLAGSAEPQEMEDYLRLLAQEEPAANDPLAQVGARLRLQLADAYRSQGDTERALQHYDVAATAGDPRVARLASSQASALRAAALDAPLRPDEAAAELAARAFASQLWRIPEGVSAAGGMLSLRATAQDGLVSAVLARPVRSLSFTAGVEFRVAQDVMAHPGSARAGLAVEGIGGRLYEVSFDGASYRGATNSAPTAPRQRLRAAVGDEAENWHTLSLRYKFETARLAACLDDEEIGSASVDLSQVRLRVLAANSGDEATGADFRNPFFRQ